ncbi:hypothetical protein Slin15195_G062020 [Septoria linicola]|uniref:Uncharacterized protein n=1 Tax=Septoria linicola TaxID=215465 RepID=A0A9Q9ATH1_9PEZI|nr:hypothetical protein Slin14017_G077830 [Septoria linicola]USW52883.1 hypothetical protein Slin15195_G062020 [Septoria linicola]
MARTTAIVRPPPGYSDAAIGPPTPLVESGIFALIDTAGAIGLFFRWVRTASHASRLRRPSRFGENSEWRREHDANRCWKTTSIYQQIGHHPRVVR